MMRPLTIALLVVALGVFPSVGNGQDLSGVKTLFERGDWPAGIVSLEALAKAYPESGDVQRLLGHGYAEAGRDGEARIALGRALQLGEATPEVLLRLARLTLRDDPATALHALRSAWSQDPQVATGLSLIDVAAELGHPEEALAVSEVLWRRGERLRDVLGRRAFVLDRLGRLDEAAAALETAAALGPPDVARLRALASLHERRRALERAAITWGRVASLQEGATRDRSVLRQARTLMAALRDADAAALLSSVKAGPERATAEFLLGHIAARARDLAMARKRWERAAELGYEDAVMDRFLADADFRDRAFEQALPRYARLATRSEDRQVLERHVRCLLETSAGTDAVRTALGTYVSRVGLDATARSLLAALRAR